MVEPLTAAWPLVAIVGPTAAGKSALALALARRFPGEVVNYDSVQTYRGFYVGSGKLRPEERAGVPHHLLDSVEPGRVFTAGDYAREASRALEGIRSRGRLPILVGGTGLYLRALLQGLFAGPARSEAVRERLRRVATKRGREFLHGMLRRIDPAAGARIEPRDTPKVIRAIEVAALARETITALHARGRRGLEGFDAVKVGLLPDRRELYARINARVERMFAGGLLDETRSALGAAGASGSSARPLDALGYRQAAAVLRGELDPASAVSATQAATRRYAKRQLTWFRRETAVTWFAGFADDARLQRRVFEWLEQKLSTTPYLHRDSIQTDPDSGPSGENST